MVRARKPDQACIDAEGGARPVTPPFVSRNIPPEDLDDVFGGEAEEYQLWRPHICGVCCVKMIGDAAGVTNGDTLMELVQDFVAAGALVVRDDGQVDGAFHHPMARVIEDLGLHATITGHLSVPTVAELVTHGSMVILSCDLAAMTGGRQSGGHLVLVYGYDAEQEAFLVHDCSEILGDDGRAAQVDATELARISNTKGLLVAPPAAHRPVSMPSTAAPHADGVCTTM